MSVEVRLVAAGALTVLAGCHMAESAERPTVIGVGVALLVVALWRELMILLARPAVIRVSSDRPVPAPARGGLGGQRGSEPVSDYRPLYSERRCVHCGRWRGEHALAGGGDWCDDTDVLCPHPWHTTFCP